MAGEWLKMECATPDKPEVLALTVRMGWDDPDLTVGKLFRLWRWFDQQTTDGNARGVTPALLDRQVGVTGFIQAVSAVGWLTIEADGITLINFDRHNGKTAKERALTAKRVAAHKANASGNGEGNAPTVSAPLPREEKKREEKKEEKTSASALLISKGIPEALALDFIALRKAKKAPLTATALATIEREAEKAGYTLQKTLETCCARGWQGFEAIWVQPRPGTADIRSVTVPGPKERDPALVKLDEDAKKTTPLPPNLRGQFADLAQQLKVKH